MHPVCSSEYDQSNHMEEQWVGSDGQPNVIKRIRPVVLHLNADHLVIHPMVRGSFTKVNTFSDIACSNVTLMGKLEFICLNVWKKSECKLE